MGPAGEGNMALSWLPRVGLRKKAVVLEGEDLLGEACRNSGGCGGLLICFAALCKEH